MDMHVRVDIDAEGAIAIKSAAPGGEARLQAEAGPAGTGGAPRRRGAGPAAAERGRRPSPRVG